MIKMEMMIVRGQLKNYLALKVSTRVTGINKSKRKKTFPKMLTMACRYILNKTLILKTQEVPDLL